MSDDEKPLVDFDSPPSAPSPRVRLPPTSDVNELHTRLRADPRFNPPIPSAWTRAALVAFVICLMYFAVTLRKTLAQAPETVQVQRYSDEYQFRPAASPVITEYLPNGNVRLRGAQATRR
ncbi:hypothetical protein BC835DRAFT_1265250 [Cytidiella melzeri]|nr:hypothetical protein BC835DRAFT_1265250 [Cytidiella melzeri]